jgi:hypothetical protein
MRRDENGGVGEVWGISGVLAQPPSWLPRSADGWDLMIAALFVIFALGLVTILMASKGVEYLIIWSA